MRNPDSEVDFVFCLAPKNLPLWTLVLLVTAFSAGDSRASWDSRYYDPKPARGDLVLPMPCGGAMVFKAVEVPERGTSDSHRPVVGGDVGSSGSSVASQLDDLAGSFSDPHRPHRYYWLAKYETSQLQWSAVTEKNCPKPSIRGRMPVTRVNWFQAVQYAQDYSAWLYKNALKKVPREDGKPGFLRLPTEAEWEYAARGGLAVSDEEFREHVFPVEGALHKYVWYQGTQSANGKLQLTGLLKPNPLGFYDMLGNVEEIMFDAFRPTTSSRFHGQAGGFITKGGHYLTIGGQIRAAYRREYAHFDANNLGPTKVPTIGFRLAIGSTVITSRERLMEIEEAGRELPQGRITDASAASSKVAVPTLGKQPGSRVQIADETRFALKTANVRAIPSVEGEKVGRLEAGSEVEVTGWTKADRGKWYRVALAGDRVGFVWGELLGENPTTATDAKDRGENERRRALIRRQWRDSIKAKQ